MRLIFARHGESEANVLQIISNRDLPHSLTQKGRVQAQALAERLAERRVVALYASPILRAQQTARIIADRLGLPINTAKALSEIDCGIMEGRGDEAAWQAHHDVVAAWDTGTYERRIEGGECFNEVKARFGPFVQELIEQFAYTDGDVVLSEVEGSASAGPWHNLWRWLPEIHIESFRIAAAKSRARPD